MSAESLAPTHGVDIREKSRPWMNKKLLIAVALVVVAAGFLLYNAMGKPSGFYMTVTELQNSTTDLEGKRIRMGGDVEDGTIERGAIGDPIKFVVSDGQSTMPIVYDGAVPDIFSDEAQVIATGTYKDGVFHADELLTKCPSRFEAADEGVSK